MTLVVLDANVLASAALANPDSPSRRVFDAVIAGRLEMAACPKLLGEVEKTFSTRYFAARIDPDRRAGILMLMQDTATMFPDPADPTPELRDPKDDYVAALARVSGAEAIVTGDKDLLEHPGLIPPAITSRQACERFDLQ